MIYVLHVWQHSTPLPLITRQSSERAQRLRRHNCIMRWLEQQFVESCTSLPSSAPFCLVTLEHEQDDKWMSMTSVEKKCSTVSIRLLRSRQMKVHHVTRAQHCSSAWIGNTSVLSICLLSDDVYIFLSSMLVLASEAHSVALISVITTNSSSSSSLPLHFRGVVEDVL